MFAPSTKITMGTFCTAQVILSENRLIPTPANLIDELAFRGMRLQSSRKRKLRDNVLCVLFSQNL